MAYISIMYPVPTLFFLFRIVIIPLMVLMDLKVNFLILPYTPVTVAVEKIEPYFSADETYP